MPTPTQMNRMYAAAEELARAARDAYPRASEKTLQFVCEATVAMALDETKPADAQAASHN